MRRAIRVLPLLILVASAAGARAADDFTFKAVYFEEFDRITCHQDGGVDG